MRKQSRAGNINSSLLAIYLLLVWLAYAYLYVRKRAFIVFLTPVIAVLLAVFLPRLFNLIKRITLPCPRALSRRVQTGVFLIAFFCTAAVLSVWRLSCWPGGFAPDAGDQLYQAMSGQYSDWHPVLHTLLFYTVPLRLTGSPYSIFLFQDLVFSASMAYLAVVIAGCCGGYTAVLSWCCIMLNPFVCYTAMFPLKDTPFALAGLVSAVISLQMWCTDGEAGKSWIRCAGLGTFLAFAAVLRHNGILFSGFLLMALLFTMKKNWWKTALVFFLVFGSVRGPLYRALNVQKPGFRVFEVTCLPMGVIGNVVKETPELLDEETREFAYAAVPRELWETMYERGNYYALKWFMTDPGVLEKAGTKKILRMAFGAAGKSPRAAFEGLIDQTDVVYGLHSSTAPEYLPYYLGDTAGMTQQGREPFLSLIRRCISVCCKAPVRYLISVGCGIVLMLVFMLGRCDLSKREDWQRILIALSVFCYDFGTMLLLGGPENRFFLISFMVCPVFVLLMLCERTPETGTSDTRDGQGEKTE